MKRYLLILAVLLLAAASCSSNKDGGAKLRVDVDSVAYVIGLNVGANLLQMDSTLNVAAVCEGIRDAFRKSERLSKEDAQAFFLRYINYSLPEKARAIEEQFLKDILKSNRSYARTQSGVTYTVEAVGDQQMIPTSDRDSVAMRYLINSADGTQIYSNYERGDTVRSMLSKLTLGLQESLRLIGKGGKIKTWLPAAVAYGADGEKSLGIPANATLYYEIELLEVDKYSNRMRSGSRRGEF